MSGRAQNIDDEPPVVGEPASQPHQAAVVGEPPEEMGPVLGEPVPLANGLQQDKEPVSSSSHDESAINGVHEETSPVEEPSSDAPSYAHSNLDSANPAMEIAADDRILTEEANSEEDIRSAIENPTQPESTSETSDARAHEASDADIPDDAEVSHIIDTPSELPRSGSQASTENPFSVLDEGSGETDLNVSDEVEEPVVTDVHDEPQEDAVSPAQDEESTKNSVPSTVDAPKEDVAHEEARGSSDTTGEPQKEASSAFTTESQEDAAPTAASEESQIDVEQKNFSGDVSEETKLSERAEAEEVNVAEPQDFAGKTSHEDDEKVQGDEKMGEKSAEPAFSANEEELVKSREAVLPDEVFNRKVPTKEGEGIDASVDASPVAAEQDVNKEAASSEADKSPSNEGEKQADSDSSLVHIDKNVTADAFPMDSSGLRTIVKEPDNVDQQPPSDETPLGENGFQHDQDVTREKEQGPTKDEKPTSRFKMPMVFTTLAIAVVGVAVASFGRSRQ